MKKILIGFASLMIALGVYAAPKASSAPHGGHVVPLDRIVAVVNSQVITETELDKQVATIKKHLEQSHMPMPNQKLLAKQVLQHLVDGKLMTQLASRMGLQVTQTQLNRAIAGLAKQNHMTVVKLKASLVKHGSNFAAFKKQFRKQLLIQELQQQSVGRRITISKEEVAALMKQMAKRGTSQNEYHLANITIPLPDAPSPQQVEQAKRKAEQIVAELNKGVSFKKLAVAHSGGKQAFKGGDLGWRHLAELPSVFEKPVAAMKVNGVAGPIHAPNGFHVLKLLGVRKLGGKLTVMQARKLLFQRKFAEQLQSWMQEVRDGAYVKIML